MSGTLRDILERRLSRRTVLGAMSTGAFTLTFPAAPHGSGTRAAAHAVDFASLPRICDQTHHVAEGYEASILIRWGDPVVAGAAAFDPAAQTAAAQAGQFGFNNDFLCFLPLPRGSNGSAHGLLWANHEYVEGGMMFANFDEAGETTAEVAVRMAAHGASIIELRRDGDGWRALAGTPYARRITANTLMRLAGPAAGHALMRTAEDPTGRSVIGTLGNCAGGRTPWGTVLMCEENVHHYFDAAGAQSLPLAPLYQRYELRRRGKYSFAPAVDRFDVGRHPHEPHRFGWVVEVDPFDPQSTPVKRTALGRFKHEGATVVVNRDGRIIVYSGDDERFEYLYRFVSAGRLDAESRAADTDLLDEGVLSVARFDDQSVTWLPLVHGQGPLTEDNGFASQAEVLIFARRAADLVGATRMDRPEDIEVSPTTGKVYVALTYNERRRSGQTDAANPRADNLDGQIIELIPPGDAPGVDHAAASFQWEMFALGGGADEADSARFSRPDNLLFDPSGRLWIATDQGDMQAANGSADCLYVTHTQGAARARFRRFFIGPVDAELTGPAMTPDGATLFVSVQHPGEPADDGLAKRLSNATTMWPDFAPGMPPRPSVVVFRRKAGGPIGG